MDQFDKTGEIWNKLKIDPLDFKEHNCGKSTNIRLKIELNKYTSQTLLLCAFGK